MTPRKRPKNAPAHQDEAAFLAAYDVGQFERPSVAVDVALLSVSAERLYTLVVQRTDHPDKTKFALPGGFVGMNESLESAAARVLAAKAAMKDVFVEQLYTFGAPKRDPRTRVISVSYVALVEWERFEQCRAARPDVTPARIDVPWEGETGGPVAISDAAGQALPLAFDHADILGMAVKRLRGKLNYTPIGFQLLKSAFTLLQLQSVHEAVLGHPVNKDSFRRRMLASGLLEATGERQQDVGHRPAELYRFGRQSAV